MSGIAGVVHRDGCPFDPPILERMRHAIAHLIHLKIEVNVGRLWLALKVQGLDVARVGRFQITLV